MYRSGEKAKLALEQEKVAEVLHAYNHSSSVPAFMVEANYEFEDLTGMDYGSPATLRRQEYWTQLSGATGQLYGNHYTWQFISGWQNYLDTTGAIQFGYMKGLFRFESLAQPCPGSKPYGGNCGLRQ